jgi:hypothetical protein
MSKKYTYGEFAGKIRDKYNAYEDVDDAKLVTAYIKKHPVYANRLKGPESKMSERDTAGSSGKGTILPTATDTPSAPEPR